MRRRKFIFSLILVFLILSAASIWYVNKYVLPLKAKAFLVQTLEKQFNRKVTLEKINYNPFKGIVLGNLSIFDREKPDDIFIKVEKINFTCLILPIFKEKKLIIPNLNFYGVQINLRRKENGWWNSEDLLSLRPTNAIKSNFQPLIYRVALSQVQISILDNYIQPSFYQEIEGLNATANFSLPYKINFRLSGKTKEKNPTQFALKGSYNLSNNFLSWQGNFKNINLPKYRPYYQNSLPSIKNLEARADLTYTGSLDKDRLLTLSKDISLTNISFATDTFSGQGNANIFLQVLINLKENKNIKYKGQANFLNFTLSHLPYVETVSNLTGTINLANDNLSTQSLKGVIYNFPFNLSGNIQDFTNPKVDLTLTSDLDLSQIKSNLPENFKNKFTNADIKGGGFLQLGFNGLWKEGFLDNLSAQLIIKNASLKLPLVPYAFEEINGNLSFKKRSLAFEHGSFSYGQVPYQLNGSLTNLAKPYIKFNLASEKLTMDTTLNIEGKDVHISQAQGKYLNCNFELNGDVFDFTQPRLNLYANTQFDLADLKDLLFILIKDFKAEEFTKWGIKGNCLIKIFVNGLVNQPKDLEIGLKLNCPSLAVKKIKLENTALNFRMKNRGITALLTTQPYQGSLSSEMRVDLNSKNPLYEIKASLSEVNLQLLVKDLDLKKKNIAGYLSAQGAFRGYGTNLETLKGQAWVEVLEGNLWEIPLLGGLANILNIPQLSKVTFKQGHGNFTVSNKQIVSKDLVLLSKEVALSAQGSLDFDGKIDVMVFTTFDPEFLKQISFLGKLLAGLSSIVQYRIYHTIDDPKFEKIIAQPTIGEGLPLDFLERFKNILKGNAQ